MILTKDFNHKKSYFTDYIITSDGHEIYFEARGNNSGIPVVFLHGGPGARIVSAHHDFFNSNLFFSILFDQRGCGKSKPFCELKNNNIQNLILDMEILREKLGI